MDRVESETSPESIDVGGSQVDQLFSLLEHRYRRYILQRLQAANRPMMREQVALEIAARKEEVSVDNISQETAQQVQIELHHIHFPKLVEESILKYDESTGEVSLTESVTQLEPLLTALNDIKFNDTAN